MPRHRTHALLTVTLLAAQILSARHGPALSPAVVPVELEAPEPDEMAEASVLADHFTDPGIEGSAPGTTVRPGTGEAEWTGYNPDVITQALRVLGGE
jgi:hypothetical protein